MKKGSHCVRCVNFHFRSYCTLQKGLTTSHEWRDGPVLDKEGGPAARKMIFLIPTAFSGGGYS
jgi:hypothetical protein